ncbi:MAG: response regulator transcription factor [Kofleriaceae bacterium]
MDGVPGQLSGPADAAAPGLARIALVVAVAPTATPPGGAVVSTLAREAIDATVVGLDQAVASAPGGVAVVLVWAAGRRGALDVDAVVAWARRGQPAPGLIAVTANDDADAIEAALSAGFDDAVADTCSPRELTARIRAVQRRVVRAPGPATFAAARRVRYRDLVLDPDSCELWVEGRAVALTVTEFATVVALLRARGAVLSRAALLDQAWGGDSLEVSERAVDNVVLRLRRKLGRPGLIKTVRGVGFRLGSLDDTDDGE